MKLRLLGAVSVCIVALSFNTNAALVDNGTYTTDDVTGLNWLDLTKTIGVSYNEAEAANPGYRYATNAEVENLFATVFSGYYDTVTAGTASSPYYGYSSADNSGTGAYSNQLNDIYAFFYLFGGKETVYDTFAVGMYMDENNILRRMGGVDRPDALGVGLNTVYGLDYNFVEDPATPVNVYGVFLVQGQSVSAVPVPAAVWLFGSGLLGLIGIARRKKA